jgi:integrase
VNASRVLPLAIAEADGCGDRQGRDRLEILTTLIAAPSFDPAFRELVIKVPRTHPTYRWDCAVGGCQRPRDSSMDLCKLHGREWRAARSQGVGRAEYVLSARPLALSEREHDERCVICPDRPALVTTRMRVCRRHHSAWRTYSGHRRGADVDVDFDAWAADQRPLTGYGACRVWVCHTLANSPRGLCSAHQARYKHGGNPGGASIPEHWWLTHEAQGRPVPVSYSDEAAFTAWCSSTAAATRPGEINLRGLRPLSTAEFQWALCVHAQQPRQTRWAPGWVQALVNHVRHQDVGSLGEVDTQKLPYSTRTIIKTMREHLRPVYFSPAQTREAGFIETVHFGVRFSGRLSQISLAGVPQRWLRELLWDYLAALLSSPRCPRGREPIDALRRGATELGVFLELGAPGGGHDPRVLSAEDMRRFVADQRHRAREGMSSLAMTRTDGTASTVTDNTRVLVFNAVRRLLREAMDRGEAERLGLSREFVVAMPTAGGAPRPARRPYTDEAARALADPVNLARLHEVYDPDDLGLRDAWETIVLTGRRVSEVLKARWDCLGRYGGLAMFWHDQTKVGNYDAAIRIPERLHDILAARQRKTLDRFTAYHGRRPRRDERAALALFPSNVRNPEYTGALTYQWFHFRFRSWVDELDLGPLVAHQARHTLATNLMRAGASLSHVRRYLGQVSNQMAEHYVHLTQADLENVLAQVWVAGPGAARPGELLTGGDTALTREQAQALALDLSRRSTPAEGGFCTFQPVVDGGACPWSLNCHGCENFVLSGADLLYWRRKREQWRLLAEGAPDDATADYLHAYFEPTARAIDGLEKALAGLGLLDDALALDLRKPQDYFQRVWATAFRAADLAEQHPVGDGYPTAGKEPRT